MDTTLITYFLPLHQYGWLNTLVEAVTVLAESEIILLVGAFLYWCIDPKMGQRMGVIAVSGVFWMLGLKNIVRQPRPYKWMAQVGKEDVLRIETATGYSFPSGHTTSAVMIYGYLAKGAKWLVRILLWLLLALIALSRIYMANHTSYDVIAALVLGFGWIYGGGWLYDKLLSRSRYNIFWFYIPMLFSILALFNHIDPAEAADTIKMCGLGSTLLIGVFLEQKHVNYTPCGNWLQRGAKYLVGMAVVLVFNFAPRLFVDKAASPNTYLAAKTVAYALIGLWMAYLYPLLLQQMGKRKIGK